MTVPDHVDHLDDETLSAVLDGEATEVGAAHATACPTCAHRLGALRLASEAIGQPIALDPDQRDAAIRAALEAPMAISLGARRRLQGRHLALVSAAAAAVIAIVAIPLAIRDSEPGQLAGRSAADSAFDNQAELRTAAPKAAAEGGMESLAAPAGPDLGELAGTDLRARLADVPRSSEGPPAPCEDRARAEQPGEAARTLSATATWNGEAAVVIVFRTDPDDTEHAYVLTQAACEVVEAVTL